MSQRSLILACRVIAGSILAGVAAVATGLVSVRTYANEVEYTRDAKADAERFKPHRCNDRLSDLLEVRRACCAQGGAGGSFGLLECGQACKCRRQASR